MPAVIDTNVLVSGMIRPDGPPGKIVDWLRTGYLELVIDDRVLHEYIKVLRRPYFARYFEPAEREEVIRYLELNSHPVVCTASASGLPDPKDAPFYEAAFTANVPLVTGNLKHFPSLSGMPISVLTPARFVSSHAAHFDAR